MARRSIELSLVVTQGNGDEGYYKVLKFPIPDIITKSKVSADDKDIMLEDHAEYLVGWIKSAIATREREDERAGVMDSW
jgi:hypothetical protein